MTPDPAPPPAPGPAVGVYLCTCGAALAEHLAPARLEAAVRSFLGAGYVAVHAQACSEAGRAAIAADLAARRPQRVVIGACSPREREAELAAACEAGGVNPFLLQVVNLREQAAWVTPDPEEALAKAAALLRAAVARVRLHEPLARERRPAVPDALVVGAGPAGIRAALTLAAAGRRVTLLERTAAVGGMPARLDRLFPTLECGSCAVEGPVGALLHGEHAAAIDVRTLAEVEAVAGMLGSFEVRVRQRPRRVDPRRCVGCGACIEACPAASAGGRRAIDFPFPGAQPAVPLVDAEACLALRGETCSACVEACPVEPKAVVLGEGESRLTVPAGGVVLATGNDQLPLDAVGWAVPWRADVLSDRDFHERLTAGCWSSGDIRTEAGGEPAELAIVHCAGSLDPRRREHCSGVCCRTALAIGRIVRERLPACRVTHVVRELVVPGREAAGLLRAAREDARTAFVRAAGPESVAIAPPPGGPSLRVAGPDGTTRRLDADIVVLCPALVPAAGAAELARAFDVAADPGGFLVELARGLDPTESRVRGVFLAGGCVTPTDIAGAAAAGDAAAGRLLAELPAGAEIAVEPVRAEVVAGACSRCGICAPLCPYRAIVLSPEDGAASVRDLLCRGCGSCVAACPSGAIRGRHFTRAQVLAEIGGLLA